MSEQQHAAIIPHLPNTSAPSEEHPIFYQNSQPPVVFSFEPWEILFVILIAAGASAVVWLLLSYLSRIHLAEDEE